MAGLDEHLASRSDHVTLDPNDMNHIIRLNLVFSLKLALNLPAIVSTLSLDLLRISRT